MLQGRSGVAKEVGGGADAMGALDDQRSRSCDMGSEMPEHLEALRFNLDIDVYGCRLRPFEVCECTVEIIFGVKLEAGPERWSGYKGGTPISTDVGGCN